jgi:hypothetical protein
MRQADLRFPLQKKFQNIENDYLLNLVLLVKVKYFIDETECVLLYFGFMVDHLVPYKLSEIVEYIVDFLREEFVDSS